MFYESVPSLEMIIAGASSLVSGRDRVANTIAVGLFIALILFAFIRIIQALQTDRLHYMDNNHRTNQV